MSKSLNQPICSERHNKQMFLISNFFMLIITVCITAFPVFLIK